MKRIFMQLCQAGLNRYLALDPESKERLHSLQNNMIEIHLLGLGFIFQLHFTATEIKVTNDLAEKPDVTLKGTPLNLLHMTLAGDNRQHFFADDVLIEGNLELGQQIIDLFDQLEIDWEDYLSRWLGDVPAHQAGRFVRGIQKWSQRARTILCENIDEYVHEEINLFPTAEALQDFFADVDTVRMDVDRLEARIKKYGQAVGGEQS